MTDTHYWALVAGYAVALLGWLALNWRFPGLWPDRPLRFDRPWLEVGAAFAAAIAVLIIGQVYMRGWRLPESGPFEPILASLNQVIIFSPVLILLWLRRQSLSTAWLPPGNLAGRLAAGCALAVAAIIAYTVVRRGTAPPQVVLARILRYSNVDAAVQVFLEDLTIAVLFVRVSALIGNARAIALVATLFAAAHIPALIAKGAAPGELLGLARDVGLGIAAIAILRRSSDIVWFWCVHFAMDMTQFARIVGGR